MNKNIFRALVSVALFCLFLSFTVKAQKSEPSVKKLVSGQKSSLTAMENLCVEEMNQARSNPKKIVGYLEDYKKLLKGNILNLPNKKGIVTKEGAAAIDDAIGELNKQTKLESLVVSDGLTKAANLQLKDLLENPALQHAGKDGSDVFQRVKKFGQSNGKIAENLTFKIDNGRQVLMKMIIDDGVKGRHHRQNIFNAKFKSLGVACGTRTNNESICVFVFADSFVEL